LKNIDWKSYEGDDCVISSFEMRELVQAKINATLTIRTGLPTLDKHLDGGVQTGELYAVSGMTKQGKTTFARTLTDHFAAQQFFPLWFTFELSSAQFLQRFPILPFFLMPRKLKRSDMNWIEDRVMEGLAKFNTRIVFIDHLHYLFDLARTRNPSIEIGTIIRRLKTIAVENDMIVFLLCHTKQEVPEVSYLAIRDSSFVAQESDSVLMISRTESAAPNSAVLRIEFHRRTGVLEKVIPLIKVAEYLKERAL
jgi:replicative DNA helicase